MKKNKAAQVLGKLGGKAKSKKKAEAARKNGKKGGRPKMAFHPNMPVRSCKCAYCRMTRKIRYEQRLRSL